MDSAAKVAGEGMSLRAWARSRRIPVSTAHKGAVAGRITRDARGRVDPLVADRQWQENTRPQINSRMPVPPPTEDLDPDAMVRAADVLQIEQERELLIIETLSRTMRRLAPRLVGRQAEEITATLLGAIEATWATVGHEWVEKHGVQAG